MSVRDIRHLTEGRGADYVFEAIGIPAVQEQCLEAVRPAGTVVLVGVSPMGSGTNLPGGHYHKTGENGDRLILRHGQYGSRFPTLRRSLSERKARTGPLDIKNL